jgi:hypothetical protein
MKKLRKQAPKRQTAEQFLAMAPDYEMLYALDNMVNRRNEADYRDIPELGRLITTLHEIEVVSETEGLGHFIWYAGARVANARAYLAVIGAERKAAILKRIEEKFPGGKIPDSDSERWEVMSGTEEAEGKYDALQDEAGDAWYGATEEDLPRLLRAYLEQRRPELGALIASRAAIGKYVPLTDDDIARLACAGDPQAFAGHEIELVDMERLSLLMRLAGDPACTARQKLFGALYGISGSMAAETLSGGQPPDLSRLQAALDEAGASADGQMREWARRTQALLADPDPLLIMQWMGDAISP